MEGVRSKPFMKQTEINTDTFQEVIFFQLPCEGMLEVILSPVTSDLQKDVVNAASISNNIPIGTFFHLTPGPFFERSSDRVVSNHVAMQSYISLNNKSWELLNFVRRNPQHHKSSMSIQQVVLSFSCCSPMSFSLGKKKRWLCRPFGTSGTPEFLQHQLLYKKNTFKLDLPQPTNSAK